MSGTYHRLVNTPRTILEAVAARLLQEEQVAAEHESLSAAEDVDTTVLDDLTPDEVSELLLDAASRGPSSYSELRGFHDRRPERQVAGDVPDDCRTRFGTYVGNGSDVAGL